MPATPAKASSSKNNHTELRQNDLEAEDAKLQAGKTAIFDQVWLELNEKNDKKLHEVLAIPPTDHRRDANGDINKSEDIFEYVPSKFQDGSKVPYDLAKKALRDATVAAVSYRINAENMYVNHAPLTETDLTNKRC